MADMKRFFRWLALAMVVVMTAGSLSTLAIREQLLKPEVYNQALIQAGVYPAIEDILVTKTAAYVEAAAKQAVGQLANQITPEREVLVRLEPLAVWYLNDLVERQTTPLVAQAARNWRLADNIQAVAEKGVTYGVNWMAGTQPDPKFLAYIPEPEQLKAVRAEGAVPFVVKQLKAEMGIEDLPPCEGLAEAATNLKLVAGGRANEISCQSEEIRAAVTRAGQIIAPQIAKTQLALTLESYIEKYQIRTLANDLFNALLDVSIYKQELMAVRANLAMVQEQAQKALWGSLVFLIIGLGLTEKKRLKTFFVTYLGVGLLMIIGAGMYTLAATNAVAQAMPERLLRISDPVISPAQNERLAGALETAVLLVVKDWVTSVKFLGGSITLLSLLGLLIAYLFSKNQERKNKLQNQQPELFEEAKTEVAAAARKKKKAKKKKTA